MASSPTAGIAAPSPRGRGGGSAGGEGEGETSTAAALVPALGALAVAPVPARTPAPVPLPSRGLVVPASAPGAGIGAAVDGADAAFEELLRERARVRRQPSVMDEIMGPDYDGAAEGEKDIDRIVAMAGNWAAGAKDNDYQRHIDSGHVIPLPAGHPPCDACHKAKIQDKPAFNFAKAHCTNQLEGVNSDLLDLGQPDCAGNRYNFTNVVLNSRLGMSKGLPNKSSVTVAKAWKKLKSSVEAKTDPGNNTGYKIQLITHDPGTEFEGAMREELAAEKVVNRIGEVDRHTDNSIVEIRNKMIANKASTIAITAMGENMEQYWRQAGCLLEIGALY